MATNISENLFICDACGQPYMNFCVHCAKQKREELVEELMDQYGLTVQKLVSELSEHVLNDRNFSALKTAIELKSMRPATKTDITSGGQPIRVDEALRARLLDKVNKLLEPGTED